MSEEILFIIYHVVDANVKGIMSMQQGMYVEALASFHEGLSTLMEQVRTTPDSSRFKSSKSMESMGHNDLSDKKIISSIELPAGNHSVFDDEVFSLFNRALHLRFDEDDIEGNEELYFHLLTAILSYNVGLAHHLCGLQTGESKVVERGLDFYSMVYSSLTKRKDYLEAYPTSINLCLLALVNNIAHIHAHFRRFKATAICNDEITFRLSVLLSPFSHISVFDEDYKIFFLNVSLYTSSDTLSAPAA